MNKVVFTFTTALFYGIWSFSEASLSWETSQSQQLTTNDETSGKSDLCEKSSLGCFVRSASCDKQRLNPVNTPPSATNSKHDTTVLLIRSLTLKSSITHRWFRTFPQKKKKKSLHATDSKPAGGNMKVITDLEWQGGGEMEIYSMHLQRLPSHLHED